MLCFIVVPEMFRILLCKVRALAFTKYYMCVERCNRSLYYR